MKVLVIGGMHGNEPLGLEVVRLLRERQSPVDTLLANEQAIGANARFLRVDLNRSFPGDAESTDYESRRAAEVLCTCAEYDVVLDFHNTHCPANDCTFIGSTATQLLYDVSSWLSLRRVIVADYDCLNKYAPNCISIEISLSSVRMDAADWVQKVERLARRRMMPRAAGLELYRFVYRMTLEDKARLSLDKKNLQAFEPIGEDLAEAMEVASPAYPIFVGDGYTPYNFGGLVNRITV